MYKYLYFWIDFKMVQHAQMELWVRGLDLSVITASYLQ